MYSRSYQAGEIPTIPESYSGVAFREPDPIPADTPRSIAKSADIKFTATPEPPDPNLTSAISADPAPEAVETGGLLSGLGDAFSLRGLFSDLSGLKLGKLGLPKIGTEEILIIGLALFLFLSKDGDKECAILLALLLLIH